MMSDANIIKVRCADANPVNVIYSIIGIERVGTVKWYDAKQHKYIDVPRPYKVKQCNSYMDGNNKIDMMSALYKTRTNSRRY